MKKRVVITGMGAVTPVGNNVNDMWRNIKLGMNGIETLNLINIEDHRVKFGAEVKNLNFDDFIDRKKARHNDRFTNLALISAIEAYENSKLHKEEIDLNRFGVIFGSGIGGLQTIENEYERGLKRGFDKISPFFIPKSIINLAAANIAIELSAKATCLGIVTACASASNAIGEAFKNIKDGYTIIMLAGGAEAAFTHLGVGGFTSLTTLSDSNDPNRASIPFDAERSGFVMGEGAGSLLLEDLDHAKNRGAKIYAEIVGYGSTCDAYHITAPAADGEGAVRSMEIALSDACLAPDDIGYINAHGTGTISNDMCETIAVKKVFKDCLDKIAISSTKSMTGHLLGASGAIEAIIAIKALEDGFMPPTINYRVPDPNCDLDVIPNVGRLRDLKYVMSNSFGFGGHNASLIFKKWEVNHE
ncbi:MAG: beta-ketoacyl-ACP synthase II [Oscillospiraceae bacterium]|nr:beta-ketoacyl-ACP synthase II [Oscillospiraceae bacterium]